LVKAAIKKGARFLLTSRDYIYRAARLDLKEDAFPLLTEGQVVIDVQALSKHEKAQIIYNHLKFGRQPKPFRHRIKNDLWALTEVSHFLPEVARRLADPMFTKNLSPARPGLVDFAENPAGYLNAVLKTLPKENRAALALVFMNGGSLQSPMQLGTDGQKVLSLLGAEQNEVIQGLGALNESLVRLDRRGSEAHWTFKHPTIRDAFADLVAGETELLDIYLQGTPVERLLEEITCGDVGFEGVKVIIPPSRYGRVIQRLNSFMRERSDWLESWRRSDNVLRFYASRCARDFLERHIAHNEPLLESISSPGSYLSATGAVDLLARLRTFGLLPESVRATFVKRAAELAVETPDVDYLTAERIRRLFKLSELTQVLRTVRTELIQNLDSRLLEWRLNYDSSDDPASYYWPLQEVLETYSKLFKWDKPSSTALDSALRKLKEEIKEIEEEEGEEGEKRWSSRQVRFQSQQAESEPTQEGERSVFDDVDE